MPKRKSTMDQAKAWERKVAKDMGVSRNARNGLEAGDTTPHELFSIEAKNGRHIPKWCYDALAQARRYDKTKVPVVAAHRHREQDGIAILYWKDFVDFFGHITDI